MDAAITDILEEFVMLFAVVDPIGSIPVFLAIAASLPAEKHASIAIRAVLIAWAVLLFFIVFGQIFLEAIGVSLLSFQLAGSLVLLLFGLNMIFGEARPEGEVTLTTKSDVELAVYPLALPSIASPGALMSVVLLTDNRSTPLVEQAITTGMITVVLLITLGALLLATRVHKLIGNAGSSIISRVMGLIIAAIAMETGIDAIHATFGTGG